MHGVQQSCEYLSMFKELLLVLPQQHVYAHLFPPESPDDTGGPPTDQHLFILMAHTPDAACVLRDFFAAILCHSQAACSSVSPMAVLGNGASVAALCQYSRNQCQHPCHTCWFADKHPTPPITQVGRGRVALPDSAPRWLPTPGH